MSRRARIALAAFHGDEHATNLIMRRAYSVRFLSVAILRRGNGWVNDWAIDGAA